jgi:uncharacterized protein YdeI (YjbR/CyaY-like superfamily)
VTKCILEKFINKNMNPKIDWFFNKNSKWQEEYSTLRMLVLDTGLVEELN